MIPQQGWTLIIERRRTDHSQLDGELRGRSIGTYRVLRDGVVVPGLTGTAVEREGPGDNGDIGIEEHRCVEAGTYGLSGHVTGLYASKDFETDGSRPRPCIAVDETFKRTAILIHPGENFVSSIGCINLSTDLPNATSRLNLIDSTQRVIKVLSDLAAFAGGQVSPNGVANARLIIVDADLDNIGKLGLRLGSHGPLVGAWQKFLTQLGHYAGAADRSFGNVTLVATKDFQKAQGLAADGHVGPQTLASARALGFGDAMAPVGAKIAAAMKANAVAATPQAAFGFASEWKHLFRSLANKAAPAIAESELASKTIELLKVRYASRPLLIGFDINIFNPPDKSEDKDEKLAQAKAFDTLAKALRTQGHTTSIYLEGAFGATGDAWAAGEARRFVAAAIEQKLCTKTSAPKLFEIGDGDVEFTDELAALVKKWDLGGAFWPFTLKQLTSYKSAGYVAAEIDNLGRPFDEHATKVFDKQAVGLVGLLGFFRSYADEYAKGTVPKLILKNIDAATLDTLGSKLSLSDTPATLPRDMFADFHIFEIDEDISAAEKQDLEEQVLEASARLGIQTVFSYKTQAYRAHGAFSDAALQGWNALHGHPTPAGAVAQADDLTELRTELVGLLRSVRDLQGLTAKLAGELSHAAAKRVAGPMDRIGAGALALTAAQKRICERVLNAFETGSAVGNYADITLLPDGPDGRVQVTYGRTQTTEYSNLRELVQMYVDNGGRFADALRPYLQKIGRMDHPLADDDAFQKALKRAGREDPIMVSTQDAFFDKRYFVPAMDWAQSNGFTCALSVLVIYDSFVHSGRIRQDIRDMFAERPPASGGNEREWIRQYVDARNLWLESSSRQAVRTSAYRTRDLKREVAAGNWDLARLPILANGVKVDDGGGPGGPVGVAWPLPGGADKADGAVVWGDDYRPAYDAGFAGAAFAGVPAPSTADLASKILASPGITLATGHVSGKVDTATVRDNIADTAAGRKAKRSTYGNAPGGSVALDRRLLAGIVALGDKYAFSISELVGGSHSPNSRHYIGVALDVGTINGVVVSAQHPDVEDFMALCRDLGATEVLGPGDDHHDHHVHAAWPRP